MTRGLTELLKAHHDKIDQHTLAIHDIEAKVTSIKTKVESLEAAVSRLEEQTAEKDENSGLRAGLREWIANIRELM